MGSERWHLIRKRVPIYRFASGSITVDYVPRNHHKAGYYSVKSTICIAQLSLRLSVKYDVDSQADTLLAQREGGIKT